MTLKSTVRLVKKCSLSNVYGGRDKGTKYNPAETSEQIIVLMIEFKALLQDLINI